MNHRQIQASVANWEANPQNHVRRLGKRGRRVGVSASGEVRLFFRHGYNDQEVSTELMMLCKRRHTETPIRFPLACPFWQELPDVRENLFRKTERHGQLKFLLKRISNRTDSVEFGAGNPPCKPGPKSCGYNWIVAAVKDLTWIFPEAAESFQVGNLRQGGDVSVQVRKGFPHFVELIKIIPIPWQSRRAAMGCDDGYPALEW